MEETWSRFEIASVEVRDRCQCSIPGGAPTEVTALPFQDSNPFDSSAGYRGLTYEEILQELLKHKELLRRKDSHIRELEDYIDNLLVRVMEETPSILRVPYEPSRKAGKFT